MKRTFCFAFFASLVLAGQLPPVPTPNDLAQKTVALKNCKVPLEVAILPPAIDKDYKSCVNAYYKPSPIDADTLLKKHGFLAQDDKLVKVEIANGFVRAYEIFYEPAKKKLFPSKEAKVLLCNESLEACFDASALPKKDKKK